MGNRINQRPRILRSNASIRAIVQETSLSLNDLIAPIFIIEGDNIVESIGPLPGYFRRSLDKSVEHVHDLYQKGIKSVLLFIKCSDDVKDNQGTEAVNPSGLMHRAIRAIKSAVPDMYVMTDVALDPYSSYGHDGIVRDGIIVNDPTTEVLANMALSHIEAGADMVAPSDMMDGRIGAIRAIFEEHQQVHAGIMSYAAKYASSFYGPFRHALDSAPGFGDKKTYQMNPANRTAAMREVQLDIEQGADIVMVKPALSYLDIIREVKNNVHVPVSAYHVSGEFAMIRAAAEKGWIDEKDAIWEATISIKRAGADLIATYFINDLIEILN